MEGAWQGRLWRGSDLKDVLPPQNSIQAPSAVLFPRRWENPHPDTNQICKELKELKVLDLWVLTAGHARPPNRAIALGPSHGLPSPFPCFW